MRAALLRTFTERLQGKQASRARAFTTAIASGVGVAVMVYRVLRSGEDTDRDQQAERPADDERGSFEGSAPGEETKENDDTIQTESGTREASDG